MSEHSEITRICDACHIPLLKGEVRYEIRIEIVSGVDPLEFQSEEVKQSSPADELKKIYAQMDQLSEEEAMNQVYCKFEYDLCPACQKAYRTNPLAPRWNTSQG